MRLPSRLYKQADDAPSAEDMEVVVMLEKLSKDIELIESNLNNVTDPVLIESFIYELKALHIRHGYYLQLCKNRGIAAAV